MIAIRGVPSGGSSGHGSRAQPILLRHVAVVHLMLMRLLIVRRILICLRWQYWRRLVTVLLHVRRVASGRCHALWATDRLLRLVVASLRILSVLHVVVEGRVRLCVS